MAINKLFNREYKLYSTQFYKKLDALILQIVNTHNIENSLIKETTDLADNLIQSEIVCRNKFITNNLAEYKNNICDIIETRNKEAELFRLLYEKLYAKIFSHPENYPVKYIMYNEWTNIKVNFPWIAHLITYINNSSAESKEYLMNLGIIDSPNRKDIIRQLITKYKLNMKNLNEITDCIHDIAESFKHSTYIKWYKKELIYIEIFEQYQNNSLNVNILAFIDKLNITNVELKNELEKLMLERYNTMLTIFS